MTYYLNGEEIEQRVPVETWQDGRHILSLHYDLQAVAAQIHEWDVWLTMAGGQVSMGKYDILGVIAGEGLAGDSEWDGIIRAEDNVHPIHFYPMFRGVQDSAELSTHSCQSNQSGQAACAELHGHVQADQGQRDSHRECHGLHAIRQPGACGYQMHL